VERREKRISLPSITGNRTRGRALEDCWIRLGEAVRLSANALGYQLERAINSNDVSLGMKSIASIHHDVSSKKTSGLRRRESVLAHKFRRSGSPVTRK
jgi:hypothetical protein